jgi:D-alanyl-D-alanine carboxypeptidase (penicillin-binding protein 5/6)
MPDIEAGSYLIKVGGKTVWARRPDQRLHPASLTKMMTVLLVLDRAELDEVATVGAGIRAAGAKIGLRVGEEMKVGHLLAAAMIQSANDACLALADHVAGSEAAFVELMNQEALKMGLHDTRFADPCGLADGGHYSTARDLALLAEKLMEDPFAAKLAATVKTRIPTLGGREFVLENTNELIGRYPGALGVKTGTTTAAGRCLLTVAERDGVRVLLVLLNAPDRWWAAVDILDHAFSSHASSLPQRQTAAERRR